MRKFEQSQPKIMVVACADSPLLRARAQIPLAGAYKMLWFSDSVNRPDAESVVIHHKRQPSLGPLYWLRLTIFFLLVYFKERPDILHVHWTVFPPLLLALPWKNVIVSPMGSDIFLPGRFSFRQRISKIVLSRASVVTSKSEFMDDQLRLLGVAQERIVRMTWGVDDSFFCAAERRNELRRKLNIGSDELVFFSPRAIKPLYRIDQIVKAFCAFRRCSEKGLLLVSEMSGSSADRERLRNIADANGLSDSVRYLGELDAEGMLDAYTVSDAVVSYSTSDGMPQTLYETMAAGCYPIFTDLPQYHALIAGIEDGYLCRFGKEDDLVAAMKYVQGEIKGHWNPHNNREKIRMLASRKSETKKMLEVYQQLLA